jgi:hypothetical protein
MCVARPRVPGSGTCCTAHRSVACAGSDVVGPPSSPTFPFVATLPPSLLCSSPIKGTPRHLTCVHAPAIHHYRRRTRASFHARSCHRLMPLAPPLGPRRTPTAIHGLDPHLPLPDFESRRLLLHGLAIAAHRSHLRPQSRYPSTRDELNRSPVPLVAHTHLPLATGKPSPTSEGTVVRGKTSRGLAVRSRDLFVKESKDPGVPLEKRFLVSLCLGPVAWTVRRKSQKNQKNVIPILLVSL